MFYNLFLSCLKTIKSLQRAVVLPIGLFFLLSIPVKALSEERCTLLFYSCESNINNFKMLKMEFDTYLSRYGEYEFQPFYDRKTFEKQLSEQNHCLVLLSSWHYRNIFKPFQINASLVGTRNGEKLQTRVLVARKSCPDLQAACQGLATASSRLHTLSILKGLAKEDSIKILTVPKDIDALMSVGFGMAKSALTNKNSFKKLKDLNPVLYREMKVIAEGNQSHLLVLAVSNDKSKKHKNLQKIIKAMPSDPEGLKLIRMLGMDGWQDVNKKDLIMLETKDSGSKLLITRSVNK